jgi:predicted neuraminidase
MTPGTEFETTVNQAMDALESGSQPLSDARMRDFIARTRKNASDKLFRRLGWMTRAHPFILDNQRLIVPLYSDGFSFSLMALTDDWGKTWRASKPLVGLGNIQPSIVRKKDGSLLTFMRDNGPSPKRLHVSESRDNGETWSPVTDSDLPNPGSGAEIISLRNGHWVLICNDTEQGRRSLAVMISDDEGRSWKWKRHLEHDPPGPEAGAYHYPSIIQARDGSLHATYSYHLNRKDLAKDADGKPMRKTIKHAHFNEEWVMATEK